MKIAIALAVVIGSSAFSAPTTELLNERAEKSAYPAHSYGGASYGGASYGGAPYGAAASYGQPCAGAPVALYLAPQRPPHYREDDVHEEHSEQARSYDGASYGAASTLGAGGLALGAASGGLGAVGYFPHAKIGGCGVPLLLSCSPNVVAGHLAKAHSAYSAPSYKNAEKQEETTELKEAMENTWMDAERAASSHSSHHHHLIAVADHHEAQHGHAHSALTA